jgi:hypothetical protein
VPGEGFIDRVIDKFKNAVVETAFVGVADIHIGTFTDTFETFELLNFGRVIDVIGDVFGRRI